MTRPRLLLAKPARLLDTGAMKSGSEIARAEGFHRWTVNELLRLTLLAPDIIEQLRVGSRGG